VAGLIVAIPALFIYSYLSSRIKDLLAAMQVFIDEFVAKMAEFYPTPADSGHAPLPREAAPVNGHAEPQPALTTNHAS
jgi:biopolymer transport protein ExbB